MRISQLKSKSIFLTDRPVSSTTADSYLNQPSLPEEAKEQDRMRASSTKTEAFPSQILFQNLTAFKRASYAIIINDPYVTSGVRFCPSCFRFALRKYSLHSCSYNLVVKPNILIKRTLVKISSLNYI